VFRRDLAACSLQLWVTVAWAVLLRASWTPLPHWTCPAGATASATSEWGWGSTSSEHRGVSWYGGSGPGRRGDESGTGWSVGQALRAFSQLWEGSSWACKGIDCRGGARTTIGRYLCE
jgi:hypothetical protein